MAQVFRKLNIANVGLEKKTSAVFSLFNDISLPTVMKETTSLLVQFIVDIL